MDYKCITSKTHRYISIRKFPSNYILNKFHEQDANAIKKFNQHTMKYHNFFNELTRFITGNPHKNYVRQFAFNPNECMKEEIHEMTGILIANAGNYDVYCIPKTEENVKIFDYIVENCDLPYKILKRTVGTYMDRGKSTHYRDTYKTPDTMKDIFNHRNRKIKKIFND